MADDPKRLVPGDPERIWEIADSFGSVGVAFEDIGRGLRAIDDGGWKGSAADAFHNYFDRQPRRFLEAADAFVTAAVALDSYASALSWAQRQAVEAVALYRQVAVVEPVPPALTVVQQAELTGVVTSVDLPVVTRVGRESTPAASGDLLHRAVDQVWRIGREAAARVREASALAPGGTRLVIRPPARDVVTRGRGVSVVSTIARIDAAPDVATSVQQHLDHDTLRDNPAAWTAGVAAARQRLRRLGLDQLSPRLKQHLFEGHLKKRKRGNGYREVGYHHREGGVDRGPIRVVRVVARPDANGVYRARVAGPATSGSELRTSTFFPDSWTRDDVLRAVRLAFHGRSFFDLDDNAVRRKWRGRAYGLTIEGYVESQFTEPSVNACSARLYHIVTAYPIYGGGRGQGC